MKHLHFNIYKQTIIPALIFLGICSGIGWGQECPVENPTRIISLAPSLTETVYALGLDDRLVGVTTYCNYPPEAKILPRIGAMLDTHYEAILALRPNLVLTTPPQDEQRSRLEKLNIATCTFAQDTTGEIFSSILAVGRLGHAEGKAQNLVKELERDFKKIQTALEGLPRPKTLVIIGRNYESDSVGQVFIASREDFLSQLVRAAGGRPVGVESAIAYPSLSREGLIRLNPEVILDLAPGMDKKNFSRKQLLEPWQKLTSIDAVKNKRVHLLTDDYLVIPGPRMGLALEDMARAIHPEIEFP
jgi:iron complex transport system substrate-binding protein